MAEISSKITEEVYKFGALSAYSPKQRVVIRLADLIFTFLIKLIGRSLRYETDGAHHYEAALSGGKPIIYAVWHNRIFAGTYYLRERGIVVITSQSFDGEYIARFLKRFGFGTVRGSSTRGGVGALVEMIRLVKNGLPTAFTVDGPKGPRYAAKAGACLLAKKTSSPILPFSIEAEKFWTIKSWDRLIIPKPFSRARFSYAEPIYVAADSNDAEIEKKRVELQFKLDELVKCGEQWRVTISK